MKNTHSEQAIYCNCCGRPIGKTMLVNQKMEYLRIEKEWGYFSHKDLTKHTFNICESCYDKWVASFAIPVEEFPVDEIHIYTEEELEVLNEAYLKSEYCK